MNRRARCKSCLLTLLGFTVPLALMALLVLGVLSRELLEVALGPEGTAALSLYLVSVEAGAAVVCSRRSSLIGASPVIRRLRR